MNGTPPPPPPPPHGDNPKTTADGNSSSGLPPGNYDIFIIPPHSAGGGFVYLPSLQPHRNSFLAGVACTLLAVLVWSIIEPTLRAWVSTVASSGGMGVLFLMIGVGVAGWACGKTQTEGVGGPGSTGAGGAAGAGHGAGAGPNAGPAPNGFTPGGFGSQQAPPPGAGAGANGRQSWGGNTRNASADWEKAREETRQREEARRKADEEQRSKDDAERAARAAAEKEKWEKMRAREKEVREREARERLARERLAKERENREREAKEKADKEAAERARIEKEIRDRVEQEERVKAAARAEADAKVAKEKAEKERAERLKAARERAERERAERQARQAAEQKAASEGGKPSTPAGGSSPTKKAYEKPTARSMAGTDASSAYSGFRPYDKPNIARPRTTASTSVYSESVVSSSYAASDTTARTTPPPPPSQRGPYATTDPDKIVIKGVYLFTNLFPKPVAQLVANAGAVTDGLVLKLTTEGLFIDDDVRGVAQREWDVKAWTMKLVDTADAKTAAAGPVHVLRAAIRDPEGKRYVFVIPAAESWKVNVGLQRLRRGSQVRALGVNVMAPAEAAKVVAALGL